MNTNQFIEPIAYNIIGKVFEEAKTLKSEITLIPRLLFQSSPISSICGYSHDSIINIGKFDKLQEISSFPLWKEPTLSTIALYTKDVNGFNSDMFKLDITPDEIFIQYHKYLINNSCISIAYEIRSKSNKDGLYAVIPLLPCTDMMGRILDLMSKFNMSRPIIQSIQLNDNEEFMNIINSKTTDGAKIWIPRIENYEDELKPYILSLTNNIITVSKGDLVYLSIHDNIPTHSVRHFMTEFKVFKQKKKCTVWTYMMLLNVVV